jgi:ATP-binding cassette subfamily B protein
MLVGITFMMFWLNWRLALVAFVTVPIIAVCTIVVRKKLRRNFVTVKALTSQINGFFAENISGMRLVQIFRREKEKHAEFAELNSSYHKAVQNQVRLNSFMSPLVDVINTLGIAILIFYGMRSISGVTGMDGVIQIGVLYAFTNYIKQFFAPINDLAEKYVTVQSAAVSCERVFELLDDEESAEILEVGEPLSRPRGKVEFRNVWFAYKNEDWVLRNVSLVIEPGQSVAFVGATGAGKTTVVNLLMRFYELDSGEILIDGIPSTDIRRDNVQEQFGMVLQDSWLFEGTVKENVVYCKEGVSDDEVVAVCKSVGLHHFISTLPQGYDTVLNDKTTLSQGQKQLVTIARAMIQNSPMMILDEATSSVDTRTEHRLSLRIAYLRSGMPI